MNIKIGLSIAIVAISAFESRANTSENLLQLHYADGSVVNVSLFASPVITFSDKEINIRSTAITISVNYDDICNFGYVISASAGMELSVKKNIISLSGNELSYDFGSRGGVIAVYDLQGRTVISQHFAFGAGVLSIAGLASGTYIAHADSSTFKFHINNE